VKAVPDPFANAAREISCARANLPVPATLWMDENGRRRIAGQRRKSRRVERTVSGFGVVLRRVPPGRGRSVEAPKVVEDVIFSLRTFENRAPRQT
jgi:hypothetical protein